METWKIKRYNDVSNIFIIFMIYLNFLYPNEFAGIIYRVVLVLAAVASLVTYMALRRRRYECRNDTEAKLMRLNGIFQYGIFISFFIVFVYKEVLYNMYFLPLLIFFIGMYFGFMATYYTVIYYKRK